MAATPNAPSWLTMLVTSSPDRIMKIRYRISPAMQTVSISRRGVALKILYFCTALT